MNNNFYRRKGKFMDRGYFPWKNSSASRRRAPDGSINFPFSTPRGRGSGQAVLLVVFVVGGVLLGSATIAGFLTAMQLQQSGDLINSARAVFAAEAGVNCALFNFNHSSTVPQCAEGTIPSTLQLTNGASATFTCYADNTFSPASIVPCNNPSSTYIFSRGLSGTAKRAFLYTIVQTPSGP